MKISIYALFDAQAPAVIKYVGQASNLNVRFNTHRSGLDETTKDWVKKVVEAGSTIGVKLLECSDEFNAIAVETKWIQTYDSPELLNIAQRKPKPLEIETFDFHISPIMSLAEMEIRYIRYALSMFDGNKQKTAKALGIGRQTLYNKLGIDPD